MRKELTDRLLLRHPAIFSKVLGGEKGGIPGMGCGNGWYPLLDHACHTFNTWVGDIPKPQPVFEQVKEKFGTLRIYYALDPESWERAIAYRGEPGGYYSHEARVEQKAHNHHGYIDGVIELACALSAATCEVCGLPGKLGNDNGWMRTMCSWHASHDVRLLYGPWADPSKVAPSLKAENDEWYEKVYKPLATFDVLGPVKRLLTVEERLALVPEDVVVKYFSKDRPVEHRDLDRVNAPAEEGDTWQKK